jgi:hypothetical protein
MNSQRGNLSKMDDLKNIAPKLSEIKKGNPFSVPINYFDDFNTRLNARIKSHETIKKPNAFIRYLKPAIALAAGLALVFTLVYWPFGKITNKQTVKLEYFSPDSSVGKEFFGIIGDLDDNSLLAIMDKSQEEVTYSDEDLISYLSSNLSSYDIYLNLAE